ncbi:MAG: DUF2380 domain-containing protein [Thermaerobacter sp.]|nr:DUF2380 domain-containing protein [Thermaerobacter sp.]
MTDATYTYDPVGNRLSADGVQYTYDAADRLTSDGTYTYAYDDSGNVTSRTDIATGAVTSFDWNAQHQLLAVHHPDGATTTYAYDALGRRIGVDAAGQATGYVYDGANIHLEYDGGSLAAVYTTGLRADSALEMTRGGQSCYYLQDGLGSTTALTDAAGSVVNTYRYDAFGNPVSTGTVPNPFTFTGREYDGEDGIYYYRARYYDPGVGRFLSEDPLPSYNPYPYAADDPVDYVDPSGAQTIDEYATLTEQDEAQAASEEETGQQVVKDSTQVLERHHLLPKQFIKEFKKVGLDVEDYTVRISRAMHRLKPGGLHTGTNRWNARWAKFFEERNGRYSAEDVLKYLDELKKEFGKPWKTHTTG